MSMTLAAAERNRVSDDMIPVTTDLILSMLSQTKPDQADLAAIIRDVHLALTDISLQNIEIAANFGSPLSASIPSVLDDRPDEQVGYQDEHGQPSVSIKRAVDDLLKLGNSSSTVFEPSVPRPVRVPVTSRLPSPPAPPATPVAPVARHVQPPAPVTPAPPVAPVEAKAPAPQKAAPPAPAVPAIAKSTQPVAKTVPPKTFQPKSASTTWTGPERRANPILPKPQSEVFGNILPRSLTSIEGALAIDYVVCLEDGKKVRGSLVEHLAALKNPMTPDQYREKWKLPAEYPMMAPSAIIKRGEIREIDLVTGKIKRAR